MIKKKKLTKKKLAKMARTAKRKSWKAVADSIRERDGHVCVVCGEAHSHLNVHHIIPREIKEFWLEPMNLISLCPRHHKFSFTESFHRNPVWAIKWLSVKRPDQHDWVMSRINIEITKWSSPQDSIKT